MYCTVADVRAMLKDDALNTIIGDQYIDDPADREIAIEPIIKAAIEDASAEIDGYLAKRYPVPLATVPLAISKYAKDIAVYNLFSRVGIDESSEEKNYLNRYNAAIKFFVLIAEGKVSLGMPTDNPSATARTGFKVQSAKRLFNRDSMRGM